MVSPGRHPISISLSSRSELSKPVILPIAPDLSSDNFIATISLKTILIQNIVVTNSVIMKSDATAISFHFITNSSVLKHRRKLKYYLSSLFKKEQTPVSKLDYIFCSDAYLLTLNLNFLKHNTFTDIITFPLSDKHEPVIAEIYISIDRVKENAIAFQTTQAKELHRVIFHGALHLCGYKDKTKAQKQIMREKEDFYLASYFVSRETF